MRLPCKALHCHSFQSHPYDFYLIRSACQRLMELAPSFLTVFDDSTTVVFCCCYFIEIVNMFELIIEKQLTNFSHFHHFTAENEIERNVIKILC